MELPLMRGDGPAELRRELGSASREATACSTKSPHIHRAKLGDQLFLL